jgi:hypothetical protein
LVRPLLSFVEHSPLTRKTVTGCRVDCSRAKCRLWYMIGCFVLQARYIGVLSLFSVGLGSCICEVLRIPVISTDM